MGRILDDAFALYRGSWRTLLLAAAVVVVPVELAVFGLGLGWLTGAYRSTGSVAEGVASAAQPLLVAPLVTAMTVHAVREAAAGRTPVAGQVVGAGLDAFRRLLPAIALVLVGEVIGFAALVIPGVILAIRWAVVPQVVVVEGSQWTGALRRSSELVAGRGARVFGLVIVAGILVFVLGRIITLPLDSAARSAHHQWPLLAGMALAQIIALPLQAAITTVLYFSLRAEKDARGAPATPEPEAALPPAPEAWDQRRREGWQPPTP
jgi:hypothetical protein